MNKKTRAFVKERLYKNSVLSLFIRWVYRTIVRLELLYARILGLFYQKPCNYGDYSNVTAVIKTFERPHKLRRMLNSIRRTFPNLKIIVVDDSKDPITLNNKDIKIITLPFDSGVSAGREAGLKEVKTPYVINLDDDYIFTHKTRLVSAITYLDRNSNVDLVAGEVTYLPYYIKFDYTTHSLMDYSVDPIYEKGTVIDGLAVYEKCANFFVARTEKLKSVGWDSQLKRLDHADFFTRARGKLTTVFDPSIELLHDQTHFDQNYLSKRHTYLRDSFVLNNRYPEK